MRIEREAQTPGDQHGHREADEHSRRPEEVDHPEAVAEAARDVRDQGVDGLLHLRDVEGEDCGDRHDHRCRADAPQLARMAPHGLVGDDAEDPAGDRLGPQVRRRAGHDVPSWHRCRPPSADGPAQVRWPARRWHGRPRQPYAVERGQALGLLVDGLGLRAVEAAQRIDAHGIAVVAPRGRDRAVDQHGGYGLRVAVREDGRSQLVGQHALAPSVAEQAGVPRGQEADRSLGVGGREGRPRHVDQELAGLVAEAAHRQTVEHGLGLAGRKAGPARDVGGTGGTEAEQVPADEVLLGGRRFDGGRAQPGLGGRVAVGPAPLPGPGRRHPDEVHPQADGGHRRPADRVVELGLRDRAVGQAGAEPLDRRLQVGLRETLRLHAAPPSPPGLLHRDGEGPVVSGRDEVDGRPQERALHDRTSLQGAGQVGAAEAHHARPEAEVHGRRVLRLDAGHALERAGQRGPSPVEQQLARQQGAVELAARSAHAPRPTRAQSRS